MATKTTGTRSVEDKAAPPQGSKSAAVKEAYSIVTVRKPDGTLVNVKKPINPARSEESCAPSSHGAGPAKPSDKTSSTPTLQKVEVNLNITVSASNPSAVLITAPGVSPAATAGTPAAAYATAEAKSADPAQSSVPHVAPQPISPAPITQETATGAQAAQTSAPIAVLPAPVPSPPIPNLAAPPIATTVSGAVVGNVNNFGVTVDALAASINHANASVHNLAVATGLAPGPPPATAAPLATVSAPLSATQVPIAGPITQPAVPAAMAPAGGAVASSAVPIVQAAIPIPSAAIPSTPSAPAAPPTMPTTPLVATPLAPPVIPATSNAPSAAGFAPEPGASASPVHPEEDAKQDPTTDAEPQVSTNGKDRDPDVNDGLEKDDEKEQAVNQDDLPEWEEGMEEVHGDEEDLPEWEEGMEEVDDEDVDVDHQVDDVDGGAEDVDDVDTFDEYYQTEQCATNG